VSTKVFKERWVNFVGDSKDGNGKFVYLSGDDQGDKVGFIIPEAKAGDVKKGAKITVKAKKDGKNWKVVGLKVDAEARSGGGGGGRKGGYGGGGNNDPKRQQSIVMQHSQEMAIMLLGKGADIGDVLKTSVVFFAQAYGPGLEAAVEAAAEMDPADVDLDTDDDDDFGDDGDSDDESDDDFDDDFDD